MRILHLIGSLENGGAEAVLYRLVTWPSGAEHHVVSIAPAAWYSGPLAERGIEVDHLDVASPTGVIQSIARMRQILKRRRPDVIQAWMYRSNLIASLAARPLSIPVVWGIHCSSLGPLSAGSRALVYAGGLAAESFADTVINCSARSVTLHERLGYGRARVEVIHNGYDTNVFYPDAEGGRRIRREFGISESTFLVGTVARWHPQKDHPNLVRAMAVLRQRGTADFRCLFVGPQMDGDNAELMSALAEAGVSDFVVCVGPRTDIPDVMRALDLHVLPSGGGEAFPNVVAEAMASSTPCLVTDIGDSAFMVGETGWVAPPRDSEALAERIEAAWREWSSERVTWRERCAAARQRVIDNFTLGPMVDRYHAVWRRAAGAGVAETA